MQQIDQTLTMEPPSFEELFADEDIEMQAELERGFQHALMVDATPVPAGMPAANLQRFLDQADELLRALDHDEPNSDELPAIDPVPPAEAFATSDEDDEVYTSAEPIAPAESISPVDTLPRDASPAATREMSPSASLIRELSPAATLHTEVTVPREAYPPRPVARHVIARRDVDPGRNAFATRESSRDSFPRESFPLRAPFPPEPVRNAPASLELAASDFDADAFSNSFALSNPFEAPAGDSAADADDEDDLMPSLPFHRPAQDELELASEPELANEQQLANEQELANQQELASEAEAEAVRVPASERAAPEPAAADSLDGLSASFDGLPASSLAGMSASSLAGMSASSFEASFEVPPAASGQALPEPSFGGPAPSFDEPPPSFGRPALSFDEPPPSFAQPPTSFEAPVPYEAPPAFAPAAEPAEASAETPDAAAAAEPTRIGEVITVFGCRGGCGATTIAVNLAGALAAQGKEVCIVDLDVQLGDVLVSLDLDAGTAASLVTIAREVQTLDPAMLKRRLVRHDNGIFVLAQYGKLEEIDETLPSKIPALLSTLARHFDAVIIDGVDDFSELALAAIDASNVVALVLTQDVIAVRRARRVIDICRQLEVPDRKIRPILNCYRKRARIDLSSIAAGLTIDVAATIVEDERTIQRSHDAGQLLLEVARGRRVTRDVAALQTLARPGSEQ